MQARRRKIHNDVLKTSVSHLYALTPKQMCRSCSVRCPKFTQSDRKERNTVITSLSTSLARLFPHGAVIHSPGPCWPSRRPPCEHLFQTEWERDHPSAGLLRIFMTGWCHSGCSLAGILLGSPRRSKTLMTHQVSWLEAVTEINRRGGGDADRIPMSAPTRARSKNRKWSLMHLN